MPDPIIFSWGIFTVRWYGLLIAAAMILGTALALREVKRRNWDEEQFLNMILVMLPLGVIGARLYFVIFDWGYYSAHPEKIIATWEGGLAIHGGLIMGCLVILFFSRRYHFGFANTLDVVAPSVILGQAIGRWGNFFNQEAYGYPVDPEKLPWAMLIDGAYRHPTFLYESLWNLLVFIFLLWFRRRPGRRSGDVILYYILLYSMGRFVIEGFRTDSLMVLGSFRIAQVVSLAAVLFAGITLWWRRRNHQDGGRIDNIR
jgi:phosphatidylglycerol:prolipoprotein diacylglycerol transferase